jgi:uncharacterized protein YndB with AHSA1/START domain
MQASETASVKLVRTIKASPMQVFEAWTDSKLIAKWMSSADYKASAETDARIGGKYRIENHGPDNQVHVTTGEYLELEPGRRLVKTWIYEGPFEEFQFKKTVLTVEFRELAPNLTELHLTHTPLETEAERDQYLEGWAFCLNAIASLFTGEKQESLIPVSVIQKFNVSPERVFDAWLDPQLIGQWMFGPNLRDEEIVSLSVDPKVGGAFSFIVRRQGQELDHIGEYLELLRPNYLSFTWGIKGIGEGSRVAIDIVPDGSGAKLILTHELAQQWADFAERTKEGWTTMLKALSSILN